jgi:hypothetical protein
MERRCFKNFPAMAGTWSTIERLAAIQIIGAELLNEGLSRSELHHQVELLPAPLADSRPAVAQDVPPEAGSLVSEPAAFLRGRA